MKHIIKTTFLIVTTIWGATLLLAPKANAYELTTEVKATGRQWEVSGVRCINGNNTTKIVNTPNVPTCEARNNGESPENIYGITTKELIPIEEGKYYRFTILLQYPNYVVNSLMWHPATGPQFTLITANEVSATQTEPNASNVTGTTAYSYMYDVTLRANTSGNYYVSFGNGTNTLVYIPPTAIAYSTFVSMGKIYEYEEMGQIEQEKQAGEEAEQQAEEETGKAGEDTEEAGQTFLQLGQGVIDIFTNTPATNCIITGDLGHIDMGELNFCQGKQAVFTPIFRVIVNLVFAFATFKLAMWVLGAIIEVTTFVMGGGKENG